MVRPGRAEWQRLLLYDQGDFELNLFLTPEQAELLEKSPPLLLSGTAGNGKSTLAAYYLLRREFHGKSKLFLTYNRKLRRFAERLYSRHPLAVAVLSTVGGLPVSSLPAGSLRR